MTFIYQVLTEFYLALHGIRSIHLFPVLVVIGLIFVGILAFAWIYRLKIENRVLREVWREPYSTQMMGPMVIVILLLVIVLLLVAVQMTQPV